MTFIHSIATAQKQFMGSHLVASGLRFALVAGVVSTQAFLTTAARAAEPSPAPMLLAQQQNGTVATMQCGQYTIAIAFVGNAASKTFSYRTRGLFLQNGYQEGDDYVFNNNDHEYRVTTTSGGTGKLQVSHYGEPVLTKQCSWS